MNAPSQNEESEILPAQAKAVGCEPEVQPAAERTLEVIEFGLGDERFALETGYVREVCPLTDLTPLPCAPLFVRGLVNVRGRIIPVIDLKQFLGLPEEGVTDLHHLLLIQTADLQFGFLAGTIGGVRNIPLEAIEPSVRAQKRIRVEYLKGVTTEQLLILDAARIVADERIIVREEVENMSRIE
jgi:purine-binding chemotaxis protein CheW